MNAVLIHLIHYHSRTKKNILDGGVFFDNERFFDYLPDSTETISCYIFTMQYEILYSKNVYLRIT